MGVMGGSSWRAIVGRLSLITTSVVLLAAGSLAMPSASAVARIAPAVTKVAPGRGPTAGGTRVTLNGHGFTHVVRVTFGSAAGTHLRVVSTTKLRVTTPRHAAGVVDVRVATSHGTSRIVAADKYRFVAPSHPAAGSYTGVDGQNQFVFFFVNAAGTQLQDVSVPFVSLGCVPAGTSSDAIQIAAISVNPDGSFSSTTTQDGVFGGHPAHFTYVFRGDFNGTTTATGQLRETVATTDAPTSTCTSNSLTWSVTRDSQPAQPSTPPPAGSYTGTDNQNQFVFLFVNAAGTQLQDVSVPFVNLKCLPAGTQPDAIQIASIAIKPDGSFFSTTTQDGTLAGHPQTFTYTFRGHVHGLAPNGQARLSGQLRESIDSTDVPTRDCTSNDQAWSVTRDAQPGQPSTPPPAGSYSGVDNQNQTLTFSVNADGTQLQNVSVPINLKCLPSGPPSDAISIASITIDPGGSFASTTHTTGVLAGHPANFTFIFNGHVHGLAPDGQARLAGQLRETIDTTDVPTSSCTSNDQSWQAKHAP